MRTDSLRRWENISIDYFARLAFKILIIPALFALDSVRVWILRLCRGPLRVCGAYGLLPGSGG